MHTCLSFPLSLHRIHLPALVRYFSASNIRQNNGRNQSIHRDRDYGRRFVEREIQEIQI